ncbi:type VI secretion system baseplate subunit TssG [Enterobacteriaceae bacterium LUAb1]
MAINNFALPLAKRFYQSVRLIVKRWRKEHKKPYADWPVNGLQLTSSLSLTATESDVDQLCRSEDAMSADFELTVNDFGLLGTHGALPHSYTEWISDQIHQHNDRAIKYFLDIFNHRLNALRFDLWKKTHLVVARELDDNFTYPAVFKAVAGCWQELDQPHCFVRPDNAGLWGRRTLASLRRLLQREFACQVNIIPFQGRWVSVEASSGCILGNSHASLGQGVVLGRKYWDIQASFHIKIGPFSTIPCLTTQQQKLQLLLEQYCHSFIEFTAEFIISTRDHHNDLNDKFQLGINSCLGAQPTQNYVAVKYLH